MQLKLQRTQRSAGMLGGKVVFSLHAQIEPTIEERDLISKYGLGKTVVYNSDARRKHVESGVNSAQSGGAWGLTKGLASIAMGSLALQCTVESLTRGQQIECKDLDELMGAEAAIVEACKNTKGYLEVATSFDGRVETMNF